MDVDKVDRARTLLGTSTLTETVDAALDEVVAWEQRRQLVDMLFVGGAEVHRLTVLHDERDLTRIAAITGQATRWVVPRGTAS